MSSTGRRNAHLTVLTNQPLALVLTSLTWALGLVSAVTQLPHGYVTGDYVVIAGPSGYAGKVQIAVTGASTFTYPVTGPLTMPAAGTKTVTYAQDTHGGRAGLEWRVIGTPWAELMPARSFDRLQQRAVEDGLVTSFRVPARACWAAGQRVTWTPRWPLGSAVRTFLVKGVELVPRNPADMLLQCEEVTL